MYLNLDYLRPRRQGKQGKGHGRWAGDPAGGERGGAKYLNLDYLRPRCQGKPPPPPRSLRTTWSRTPRTTAPFNPFPRVCPLVGLRPWVGSSGWVRHAPCSHVYIFPYFHLALLHMFAPSTSTWLIYTCLHRPPPLGSRRHAIPCLDLYLHTCTIPSFHQLSMLHILRMDLGEVALHLVVASLSILIATYVVFGRRACWCRRR